MDLHAPMSPAMLAKNLRLLKPLPLSPEAQEALRQAHELGQTDKLFELGIIKVATLTPKARKIIRKLVDGTYPGSTTKPGERHMPENYQRSLRNLERQYEMDTVWLMRSLFKRKTAIPITTAIELGSFASRRVGRLHSDEESGRISQNTLTCVLVGRCFSLPFGYIEPTQAQNLSEKAQQQIATLSEFKEYKARIDFRKLCRSKVMKLADLGDIYLMTVSQNKLVGIQHTSHPIGKRPRRSAFLGSFVNIQLTPDPS